MASKSKGSRKHGRNKVKCGVYKSTLKWLKHKLKRMEKTLKRQPTNAALESALKSLRASGKTQRKGK